MTEGVVQSGIREIVVDEVFPYASEKIWATLIHPDLMARWLGMTPIGFEPVVGNRFTYQTRAAGEWDGTIRCEVIEVLPGRRLAYLWRGGHEDNIGYGSLLDTVVTLTLEPAELGTRLRLVHSGFDLPRNETAYHNMRGGWTGVVTRIHRITDERI